MRFFRKSGSPSKSESTSLQPRLVVLLDFDGVVNPKQLVKDIMGLLPQAIGLIQQLREAIVSNDYHTANELRQRAHSLLLLQNRERKLVRYVDGEVREELHKLLKNITGSKDSNLQCICIDAYLEAWQPYQDIAQRRIMVDAIRWQMFQGLLQQLAAALPSSLRDVQLEFAIGTNRQHTDTDLVNAGPAFDWGSCVPFYMGQVASQFALHTITMVDVLSGFSAGTNWQVMQQAYQAGQASRDSVLQSVDCHLGKHSYIFDQSKVTLLYAQMHYQAMQSQNKTVQLVFVDDSDAILNGVHKFFAAHPDLIPKNVVLTTQKMEWNPKAKTHKVHTYPPVTGTGDINVHFDMWCYAFAQHNAPPGVALENAILGARYPLLMPNASSNRVLSLRDTGDRYSSPRPNDVKKYCEIKTQFNYENYFRAMGRQLDKLAKPDINLPACVSNAVSALRQAIKQYLQSIEQAENHLQADYLRYCVPNKLRYALRDMQKAMTQTPMTQDKRLQKLNKMIQQLCQHQNNWLCQASHTIADDTVSSTPLQGTLQCGLEDNASGVTGSESMVAAQGIFAAPAAVIVISEETINQPDAQKIILMLAQRTERNLNDPRIVLELKAGYYEIEGGIEITQPVTLQIADQMCQVTIGATTVSLNLSSAGVAPDSPGLC